MLYDDDEYRAISQNHHRKSTQSHTHTHKQEVTQSQYIIETAHILLKACTMCQSTTRSNSMYTTNRSTQPNILYTHVRQSIYENVPFIVGQHFLPV